MRVFCGLFLYRIFSRDFEKILRKYTESKRIFARGSFCRSSFRLVPSEGLTFVLLGVPPFPFRSFSCGTSFRTLAVRSSWLQSFATAPPFFVRLSWRNFLPRTLVVRRYRLNARCVISTHFAFYPFRRRLDLLRNFQNEGLTFVLLLLSFVVFCLFIELFFCLFFGFRFLQKSVRRVLVLIQVASLRSATTSPRQNAKRENEKTNNRKRRLVADPLAKAVAFSSIIFLFFRFFSGLFACPCAWRSRACARSFCVCACVFAFRVDAYSVRFPFGRG